MTILIGIAALVCFVGCLVLGGFVVWGKITDGHKRTVGELSRRNQSLQMELNSRSRLCIGLALKAKGTTDKLRVAKSILNQIDNWTVTPAARPDGGLDVVLKKKDE